MVLDDGCPTTTEVDTLRTAQIRRLTSLPRILPTARDSSSDFVNYGKLMATGQPVQASFYSQKNSRKPRVDTCVIFSCLVVCVSDNEQLSTSA
jgi:hypothetical protein